MESTKAIQMSFRLPCDLHLPCKELADKQGQTLAEWIRRAMQEKLERDKDSTSNNVVKSIPEKQLRDLMRQVALDVYSEKFDNREVYSGTVHGMSLAEPDGKKFEKATLKQKSY